MTQESTRLFYGDKETTRVIRKVLAGGKRIDIFADAAAPAISMGVEPLREGIMDMIKAGSKMRFLTEITKDNVARCKELAKIAEVKHLDGIKGGMAVSDKEYMAAVTLIKDKPVPHLIYSNVREIVDQNRYMFETLWNMARPGMQRIAEIDQGREPEFTELISEPSRATKAFVRLLQSAEKKVSLLLPHKGSFQKAHDAGVFDVLVDKVAKKGVDVRVICPLEGTDGRLVSAVASKVRLLSGHEERMSMLVVDDERCFVVAERDRGDQYGGFMLQTNSPPAVRSFNSLFDIQWRELSLIDSLLQMGKQRDEFISVAAHELRNPITPIMLFVDGLKEEFGDRPEIAGIMRNTKRLQRLLQDVLDSGKVDNKNLVIKKTQFSLSDLLREACADAQNQARSNDVKIVLEQGSEVAVVADPARISQVVYNLLDNALKFTANGAITVSAKSDGKKAEVVIRDEGSGIDPEVLPRLFGKFVTASDTGTGIGLYLCKAIVEAHGGKIRGSNNPGSGSTFSFTIPLN